MFVLNFALSWGEILWKHLICWKYISESRKWIGHSFLPGFPSSRVISVEVAEHLGCPSMSKTVENMDQVKKLVHENRKVTVHEVSNMSIFILIG
jgi:hypothetical protein